MKKEGRREFSQVDGYPVKAIVTEGAVLMRWLFYVYSWPQMTEIYLQDKTSTLAVTVCGKNTNSISLFACASYLKGRLVGASGIHDLEVAIAK